jgi:hypothetical protein
LSRYFMNTQGLACLDVLFIHHTTTSANTDTCVLHIHLAER